MAGFDNYEALIKSDAETIPGGSGAGKISMTDDSTGDKFEMKQKRGNK